MVFGCGGAACGAGDEEDDENRSAGIADEAYGAGDVDVGRCDAGAKLEPAPVLPKRPMISSMPPLCTDEAEPLLVAGIPPPKMSARRSVVACVLLLPNWGEVVVSSPIRSTKESLSARVLPTARFSDTAYSREFIRKLTGGFSQ